MFDGTSREKRLQLVAPMEGKDKTLSRVREARQLREKEKRNNGAATRIQSAFRGYRTRVHFSAVVREDFDIQALRGCSVAPRLFLRFGLLRNADRTDARSLHVLRAFAHCDVAELLSLTPRAQCEIQGLALRCALQPDRYDASATECETFVLRCTELMARSWTDEVQQTVAPYLAARLNEGQLSSADYSLLQVAAFGPMYKNRSFRAEFVEALLCGNFTAGELRGWSDWGGSLPSLLFAEDLTMLSKEDATNIEIGVLRALEDLPPRSVHAEKVTQRLLMSLSSEVRAELFTQRAKLLRQFISAVDPQCIVSAFNSGTTSCWTYLYATKFVSATFASVLASRNISAIDDTCAMYIQPWLRYATTPERRRKALPLLSKLAYTPTLLRNLWVALLSMVNSWACKDGVGMLSIHHASFPVLFFNVYNVFLNSSDIHEGFDGDIALSLREVQQLVTMLRDHIFRAHVHGYDSTESTAIFVRAATELLVRIHIVDERAHFLTTADWTIQSYKFPVKVPADAWDEAVRLAGRAAAAGRHDDDDSSSSNDEHHQLQQRAHFDATSSVEMRVVGILLSAPFIVPFFDRVGIFGSVMMAHRDMEWGAYMSTEEVRVRRSHLFSDAFSAMHNLDAPRLLGRTRVRFVDDSGNVEPGYGEGVFREFMLAVCQNGFSPSSGLFLRAQTSDAALYPRPYTEHFVGEDYLQQFRFLGRMLGKALREGILLDIPFAQFFRNSILGRTNGFNDLYSLDPELAKQLVALRSLKTDREVDDLFLTFSVTVEVCGSTYDIPLISHGSEVAVTRKNLLPYIHIFADFKLNREIRRQSEAFRHGLYELVDANWLRVFDSNELQVLLRGTEDEAGLDVADWQANTHYHNYSADHPTIRAFWEVVSSMTPQLQRAVLKFATGASRAPLLGFRHMTPQFSIANNGEQIGLLPTAATCMCLLKIPQYPNAETLRPKLLQAITDATTFELS